MIETEKPFACTREGCKMAFTNEDHLNVHKKKHDMALHLGIDNQNNTVVADQTPTPTRFIRNCEEVGLFQDLQNVNPFDETFRKATELAKAGTLHIPETSADDTLHTPHIFPHIEEGNNISKFSRNISNDPEFTVTTIDDDLLKLSDKNTNDVISNKLESNTFLSQSDPVISSHSTLMSNINHDIPTPTPVSFSFTDSDIPPAVVNNLSDIIKQNCLNKSEDDGEDTLKARLKEKLRNRVKTEESESDDCDAMVIHEMDTSSLLKMDTSSLLEMDTSSLLSMDTSSLFANSVSSKIVKSHQKRVTVEHSIKENHKKTTDHVSSIIQNKIENNGKRPKLTQSQLQRQREVNRAAQIRSREKKKYLISHMENEIEILKEEKKELWIENQNMQNEMLWLKTMLLYHKDCPVARDPQIKEEINQLVKVSREELKKKMQKNPLKSKKMVPIRPNPTNIIAVTPVPVASSVLVQVPASVPQPIPVLTPMPVPVSIESPAGAVQLNTLPALKARPLTPTISCDNSLAATNVTGMPKLLPSSVPSLSVQSVAAQNPLKAITIAPSSTPKLMIKLPSDASASSISSKSSTRQQKSIKANNRLKVNRKREKKLHNLKANPDEIIRLPNTILPDNNYFILAKPKNFG